ncbi:Ig-like domain-containing protein [Streptomyces sp. NPDC051322]|uniref:L,D-transpeptidase n=1 Tax=Streptomyces sp. NPDC051322 TaxID=3154645 RepID=UPI00344FC63B
MAVLLAIIALVPAACSTDSGGGDGGSPTSAASSTPSMAPHIKITTTPKDGAAHVPIGIGQVRATVQDGTLTTVTLTDQNNGKRVPGAISSDRTSWQAKEKLQRGTPYTLTAVAKDRDGKSATKVARFTTASAKDSAIAFFTPEDKSTVGVGMEVSFKIDKPVRNEKAVQSAISVVSSTGQQVVGHWFGNQRLDFRPAHYWKPGSTVTVGLHLAGVEVSPGVFGVQDKTFSFTVGRTQISTVDAAEQSMAVVRDGSLLKIIPISSGSPAHGTYNGTMVISEKYQQTKMDSTTVGLGDEYNIPDVPHAQRLTASGTFVHGNYWAAPGVFGSQPTSHGCIGMQDAQGGHDSSTNGAWFYDNSLIGDVVIVKNSVGGGTVAPDNGLNGWNMDWNQWKAGSAL